MEQLPKVDITILSWDRLDETLKAIDSALNQKGINSRIIVVDQGSTTSTLDALKDHCNAFTNVTLICNENNVGVPGGRNQAASYGDADYIVALDNDAEFIDHNQVQKACKIMDAELDIGALSFRILRFGCEEDDASSWPFHQDIQNWADRSFDTDRFVGAGHMLRRDLFDQLHGYDSALFFLHEEVELSKRIINKGFRIHYTSEVVIGHKVSAEHRVAWTGGRWQYDVRNRTYLHLKFRTFLPTAIFHTSLMVWKGVRSGMFLATLNGLFQAFFMLPRAVRAWIKEDGLTSNEAALAYLDKCSPTSGMSVWQRVKMRFANNTPLNVKSKG